MASYRALLAAAVIAVGCGHGVASHAQSYPPEGYAALLFDPADTKFVFRLNGMPWICRGDTFCKPVKIDGVADKDLAQAAIEPLGFAGPRYLLSYKQANFEKGKEAVLSCTEERCGKLDLDRGRCGVAGQLPGEAGRPHAEPHGHSAPPRGEGWSRPAAVVHRERLLGAADHARQRILPRPTWAAAAATVAPWRGCATRRALSCPAARPRKASATSSPATRAGSCCRISPPRRRSRQHRRRLRPRRHPHRRRAATDAERATLAASIDRAIAAGDFATADRLLADATRRFAGSSAWPPLQQKLAKARADVRQAEARRLIGEARRFAQAGDFTHAEAMLQEADKQMPGFAETAQARAEIANLRTARGQRYRDRQQFEAAIDQALATNRLFEAERLLADYAQRYGQDPDYRARASRLAELRGAAPNQTRVDRGAHPYRGGATGHGGATISAKPTGISISPTRPHPGSPRSRRLAPTSHAVSPRFAAIRRPRPATCRRLRDRAVSRGQGPALGVLGQRLQLADRHLDRTCRDSRRHCRTTIPAGGPPAPDGGPWRRG